MEGPESHSTMNLKGNPIFMVAQLKMDVRMVLSNHTFLIYLHE